MAPADIDLWLISFINLLCGLWKVGVCWIAHRHVVQCSGSQSTNESSELCLNAGKAAVPVDQFNQLMPAFLFIHLNILTFYEPTNNK